MSEDSNQTDLHHQIDSRHFVASFLPPQLDILILPTTPTFYSQTPYCFNFPN